MQRHVPANPRRTESFPATVRALVAPTALAVVALLAALAAAVPVAAQPFDAWAIYGPGAGYAEIPDHPDLDPTTALTLEAWVFFDPAIDSCPSIVGKGFDTSYWLGWCSDELPEGLRSWIGGEPVHTRLDRPIGRWFHVAVTSDGVRRKHYFDGALLADVAESGVLAANALPVQIGHDPDWDTQFTGVIDEVRLWNVARTQDQIRDYMHMAIDLPQLGLVAVWSFGPQDTFDNHSGNIVGNLAGLTFPPGECWTSTSRPCLAHRFWVDVDFMATNESGIGKTTPARSDDTAVLWFFNPDNWEMLVKVLDACSFNNRFWVFAAAATDVGYTLRVTDSLTGAFAEYSNPNKNFPLPVTDISALDVCNPFP